MKEKKIGLVELSHCKAFYSSGKILWRDYGKKYEWKYIFLMLVIFWPLGMYYAIQKDIYMKNMTGVRNWAGAMKYICILVIWIASILMICIWIAIIDMAV